MQLSWVAFSAARIVYASMLLLGYYFSLQAEMSGGEEDNELIQRGWTRGRQLLPSARCGVKGEMLPLLLSFMWQGIEKLLLTEGEKFVLRFTASLVDQAAFSVVHNLGSLVARFLFQPVEEVCFALFSILLGTETKGPPRFPSRSRSVAAILTFIFVASTNRARHVLGVVVHFMCIIGTSTKNLLFRSMERWKRRQVSLNACVGMIFLCFGTNYCRVLLTLLYGARFDESSMAPQVLRTYCVFVMFMGLNGTSES